MDGSYNQPFGRSQSPMSPQTPQTPSSSYQVNVSRQKTRKWVEAKVQNYDGDDWGGDDYDEPEEPVPAVPAKDPRPAVTSRLPSESRAPRPSSIHVPSSLSVAPASSTSSAGPTPPPSGLPSLQDETKQNTAITAASQPPPRALTSPPLPESPALGGAHGRPFPVSPQNPVAQRDRAEPGIATRVADDQPPLPPPKDTLPPLPVGSEDNSVQRILLQDGPAPLSQPTSAQPQQAADEPALATAADINRDETSGSPQLPNVSRLSSFGIEFSLARPEATPSFDRDTMEPSAPTQTKPNRSEPSSAFAPPPVVSDVPTPDTTEQAPIESPALPPVPQQSTNTELGARQEAPADKAGTSPDPIPDTPEAPQQGRITRPSLPGGWITETPSVPEQTRGMDDDGGKVESEEVSRITQPEHRANLSSQAQGSNGSDPRTLPPLITPSSKQEGPNGPFAHAEATVSSASPGPGPAHASGTPKTASSDIPPTQPLQPQKHWHSPVGHDLQPVQTQTTYSTVTSSPEKESDLLRDEIIRSLTPRHEVPPTTIPVEDQEVQAGVRDSTYSLSGYDAYWADTTTRDGTRDKTTDTKQAPLPDPTIEPDRNDSIVAPLSPIKSPNTKLSEPTSDERKRFSWEMESQAQREKQTPEKPDDDRSTTAAKVEESSQAPAVVSVESGEVKPAVRDHEVPKPDAQLTGLAPVSHQVSKASTNPPTAANPQSPEPPSPISMASEKPTAQAATQRQPAPVKEETSSWAAPPQHQPVPPAEASEVTPPAPPPPASKTLPSTFKDIMGRPSSAERIAKFDETRETFATLDSGLGHWISAVKSQHAEHTNVTSSFHAANGPAQNQATSTTPGHAPTPQPYYQQYINASSQAVNSPGAGRGRVGGPAGPGQGNSSSFGPSSNQIGTKSKEFMQSAGKKGMGLLHKGRNKLRGTGDKDQPPASSVTMAPKQRAERRTSWGLSMGAKSRNGSAQSSTQLDRSSAASPTPGPQFHRPSLSDVPENSDVPAGQGRPSRDSLRQIPSGGRTMLLADDRGGGGREDPYRGTPWQASSTVRASLDQHRGPSDRTRPSMDSVRTGAPAPSDQYSHMSPVAEDSGVSMPLHADAPDGPKRSTSFVGLPPIRRNSSLNFMGDALHLPGLSFLADPGESDDDSDDGQNGRDPKPAVDAERPASPREPVAVESKKEPDPPSLDEAPAQPKPAVVQVSPALVQTPLLSRLPAGPWKLEESHLTEPLNQVSRNRSGTGGSIGPVVYGYDKETGLPLTRSPDLSQSPRPAPSTDAKPNFPPSAGQGYSDRSLHRAKQGSVDSRMTGDLRGDEVSETSVTTDGQSRRKKRTSFLRGFRGRDNASLASPSQESFHRRQGSFASEAESHSDRKRSLLSNAVNGGSSHSRLLAQATRTPGPSSISEQERRLSGLPPNESSVQAGGVDQGTRQVLGDRRDVMDLAPPQLPAAQGRRNRSGSGSGVIAGLLSHIPGSRNRDANRPSNIEIKHPITTSESKLSTETGRRGSQLSPALQGYGNERASPREAMQAQKAVATEVRIVRSPTPSGTAPPVPPPPPPSQRLLPDGNDPMYDQLYGPPKPPAAAAQRPIGHGRAGERMPDPHPEQPIASAQNSPSMTSLASQGRVPYQSGQSNQGVAPNQNVQAQPTGRSGGLFKGLRRVTDQVSQATQRNEQSKGDKPAGRVLNAFRRGPKQAEKTQAPGPTQNIPQWRPSQPDLQPGQARPPQLRAAQQPPPPAQSVPLSQKHPGTVYGPPGPAPVGPTPPAPSHNNRTPPGQLARHGQVPMPPGFTAVRSEGEFVPTNYGTGRGMQQGQRQSPQQQASAAQQRQSSLQQRGPGAQGAITQQRASNGSPPDRGINSSRAVQGALATPPVGGGMQRPEGARVSSSYYGSPPMATPDSTRGARGANNADAYRQMTVSPDLPAQTRSSIANGPAPNLGIDVGSKAQQDTEVSLYNVRPTLGASSAGTSNSDVSRTTVGDSGPRVKESMDDGPRAELEDTEEARKRTQRLEAQEEKIFCDPEDDPNHMPQMSATSYPGQEWNPYGMAEYAAEWRDD